MVKAKFDDRNSNLVQDQQAFWYIALFLFSHFCETAGEKFGSHKLRKIINSENAEIDDLSVIRDGDHLFFLDYECDNTSVDAI